MQENRISIKISDADKATAQAAITTLKNTLTPYLIALSNDDRQTLPKMGDSNLPFVQKAVDYSVTNPQFVPAYIDVPELKVDVDAVGDLLDFFRPLEQVYSNLNDTIMLSGSEAYVAALAYYNSVKLATKMKVPGAEAIYNDLSQRFVKPNAKPATATPTPKTA
jgi:hypothetical protein